MNPTISKCAYPIKECLILLQVVVELCTRYPQRQRNSKAKRLSCSIGLSMRWVKSHSIFLSLQLFITFNIYIFCSLCHSHYDYYFPTLLVNLVAALCSSRGNKDLLIIGRQPSTRSCILEERVRHCRGKNSEIKLIVSIVSTQ